MNEVEILITIIVGVGIILFIADKVCTTKTGDGRIEQREAESTQYAKAHKRDGPRLIKRRR